MTIRRELRQLVEEETFSTSGKWALAFIITIAVILLITVIVTILGLVGWVIYKYPGPILITSAPIAGFIFIFWLFWHWIFKAPMEDQG